MPFLWQTSCFCGAILAVCIGLCFVRTTGDEVLVAATFTGLCFATAAGEASVMATFTGLFFITAAGEASVMATFTGLFFITAAGDEASRIAAAPFVRQSNQKHHSNKILYFIPGLKAISD